MRILRIEKNNPFREHYKLVFDDGGYCDITGEELTKFKLKKGLEISAQDCIDIKDSAECSFLKSKCIDYIALKPRSEKEIRDYIKKKLYGKEIGIEKANSITSEIIEDLRRKFLVNDQKFAQWYTSKHINSRKPKSRTQVKYELINKGIQNDDIENSLSFFSNEDEFNNACILAEKKYKSLIRKELSRTEIEKKIAQYLYSKGYHYETALKASSLTTLS